MTREAARETGATVQDRCPECDGPARMDGGCLTCFECGLTFGKCGYGGKA